MVGLVTRKCEIAFRVRRLDGDLILRHFSWKRLSAWVREANGKKLKRKLKKEQNLGRDSPLPGKRGGLGLRNFALGSAAPSSEEVLGKRAEENAENDASYHVHFTPPASVTSSVVEREEGRKRPDHLAGPPKQDTAKVKPRLPRLPTTVIARRTYQPN